MVVVVSDFVVSELELGLLLVSLEPLVEPAPAVPVPLVDEELDGVDEDAPPLALSFFWISTEVDEELEPDGVELVLGAAVVPLADEDEDGAVLGELVEPEPDGVTVVDELDAPEGALLSAPRSHPASAAAPNAMETAIAKVENLMWPPWLGYVNQ